MATNRIPRQERYVALVVALLEDESGKVGGGPGLDIGSRETGDGVDLEGKGGGENRQLAVLGEKRHEEEEKKKQDPRAPRRHKQERGGRRRRR
jgi:hypothetical protein